MAKRRNKKVDEDSFLYILKFNMDNTPGFTELLKVVVFILICVVLVIVARVSISKEQKSEAEYARTSTTTVASQQKSSYKSLVDKLLKKTLSAKVTINGTSYLFENIKYSDETVTGLFETSEKTTKFKVDNTSIYESKLGEYIENKTLFGDINMNFIVTPNLVKILESNKNERTITDENVTYTYNLTSGELSYEVNVTIVEDQIVSIIINNDNETYDISIE